MLWRLLLGLLRMLVTRLKLRDRGERVITLLFDYANTSIRLRCLSAYTTSLGIGAMASRMRTHMSQT